jgi:hypothetical protein
MAREPTGADKPKAKTKRPERREAEDEAARAVAGLSFKVPHTWLRTWLVRNTAERELVVPQASLDTVVYLMPYLIRTVGAEPALQPALQISVPPPEDPTEKALEKIREALQARDDDQGQFPALHFVGHGVSIPKESTISEDEAAVCDALSALITDMNDNVLQMRADVAEILKVTSPEKQHERG